MTAHHDLTGWDDFDDHPQYHNDARGDARYLQLTGGTMTGPIVTTGPNIDITSASAIERYFRAYGSSGGASFGTDVDGNLLIGLLDATGAILKPMIAGTKFGPVSLYWDGQEKLTTLGAGTFTSGDHQASRDLIANEWTRTKFGLDLKNSDLGLTDPDVQGQLVTAQLLDQNAILLKSTNETAPAVGFQIDNGLLLPHEAYLNEVGNYVMERPVSKLALQQVFSETPTILPALLIAGIDPNDVSTTAYLDPAEPAVPVWDLALMLEQILIRTDANLSQMMRIDDDGTVLSHDGLIPPVVNKIGAGLYEVTVPFSALSQADLIPIATVWVTPAGNKPFTVQADAISINTILVSTGSNNATGDDAAFSLNVAAVAT